jgi:hypothetical protein
MFANQRTRRLSGSKIHDSEALFTTRFLRRRVPDAPDLGLRGDPEKNWAIVMQGPVVKQDRYTYNTIKLYRTSFPSIPVILSTWANEDPKELEAIRKLGCEMIITDPSGLPTIDVDGHSFNPNLQIRSSNAGLTFAKSLGSTYAVKTRTDQRVCRPIALQSLKILLSAFPLNSDLNQNNRIVVSSLNTFAYRLYGVSDMFMFGHIDDMLVFWNGQLDERKKVNVAGSLRNFAEGRLAEVWLTSNFLVAIGAQLEWSVSDYWSHLGKQFVVVDSSYLDMHWPKYTDIENRWGDWRREQKFTEVSLAMWLAMLDQQIHPDETILDRF